jgi:phage/plasmid-like protein (TIGR03299 family)
MAYRFADRRDVPWHGLGTPIGRNEDITTEEFRRHAGAHWEAIKYPLWVRATLETPFKEHIKSDAFALMRTDTHAVLNIVSEQYKPVQNREVFDFFSDFCNAGDMDLETGGVLNEGRTVWALASIRAGFTLAGGDSVQGYCLFSNRHDGHAGRIKFTPVRVVCANTLALAMAGDGSEFRIHHRSQFNADLAKTTLGLAKTQLEQMKEQAEFLASRPMNHPAYLQFLDALFPVRKAVDALTKEERTIRPHNYDRAVQALWQQTGAELNRGTWWQGYNAITYMLDHQEHRKDRGAALNSNWFGEGMKLKKRALDTALEMAK